MLTGSFAGARYGASRATQDIDIVIEATPLQLKAFIESLPPAEYYVDLNAALEAQRRESLFNVIDLTSGWKIDFIFRKSRAFSREEFKRRQQVTVQELPMFVTTAEDVVIAKLEWAKLGGSLRQIEDVVAILGAQGEALDKSYVEKWIMELGLIEQWTRAKRLAGLPS
jgi:hypothetical protein